MFVINIVEQLASSFLMIDNQYHITSLWSKQFQVKLIAIISVNIPVYRSYDKL